MASSSPICSAVIFRSDLWCLRGTTEMRGLALNTIALLYSSPFSLALSCIAVKASMVDYFSPDGVCSSSVEFAIVKGSLTDSVMLLFFELDFCTKLVERVFLRSS